jgi:hypothetical protein
LRRPQSFQSSLDIERGFDRRAPPLCTSYRFVQNGLQETIVDRYVLYGAWNRLFGCWMVSAKNPKTDHQEIVPDWPILQSARDRVQADQMSVLRHRNPYPGRQVVLGKRSSYHFAQYLDGIPTVIQNLCRPFGPWQWLALDMVRQTQGFMWFLLGERQEGRLGYIAACLAGLDQTGLFDRATRRQYGQAIMLRARRDVLSDLYGQSITRSTVRIVERLPSSISYADMQRVLETLADEKCANALRHAERVSMEIVQALLDLPPDFRCANASDLIAAGVSASGLEEAITTGCQMLEKGQRNQAAREFRGLKAQDELAEWREKWREIGQLNRPFPPVPIATHPPLLPITGYEQLKQEGRAMRNCVATYLDEVLSGDVYFYHWDGEEPASVCVVSTPVGDWFVEEALGYRNQTLSEKTSQLIESHLKKPNGD